MAHLPPLPYVAQYVRAPINPLTGIPTTQQLRYSFSTNAAAAAISAVQPGTAAQVAAEAARRAAIASVKGYTSYRAPLLYQVTQH